MFPGGQGDSSGVALGQRRGQEKYQLEKKSFYLEKVAVWGEAVMDAGNHLEGL